MDQIKPIEKCYWPWYRVVASRTSGPRFESRHPQILSEKVLTTKYIVKRKIVNKEMNIIKILRKLRFIKWFKVMNINSH